MFGELFRATGWRRDEVTVANKLWWEHWPDEDATAELDGSLGRMGLDHVDLIYAIAPPPSLPVTEVVGQVAVLIETGRARAWGTGMWSAAQLAEAVEGCDRAGRPPPGRPRRWRAAWPSTPRPRTRRCAPRSLPARSGWSRRTCSPAERSPASTSTAAPAEPRTTSRPFTHAASSSPSHSLALAAEWGVTATHLAFCYALDHPNLASVLFGATSPEQVRTNVESVAVYDSLDREQLDAINALAAP